MIYSALDFNNEEIIGKDFGIWDPFGPIKDPHIMEKHIKFGKLFGSYEWDLMVMGIAQHYGMPTHGLDITNELYVAEWFATNEWFEYKEGDEGYCWYKPRIAGNHKSINDLPVIYVVTADNHLKRDLDQIEYIGLNALRPVRQKAYLHYGGWGLHSNICAQDVVAALFLDPDYTPNNDFTTEFLFPTEGEDTVYRALLEAKRQMKELGRTNYGYIARYKPPFNDQILEI